MPRRPQQWIASPYACFSDYFVLNFKRVKLSAWLRVTDQCFCCSRFLVRDTFNWAEAVIVWQMLFFFKGAPTIIPSSPPRDDANKFMNRWINKYFVDEYCEREDVSYLSNEVTLEISYFHGINPVPISHPLQRSE